MSCFFIVEMNASLSLNHSPSNGNIISNLLFASGRSST
jgi:hypothetical protein